MAQTCSVRRPADTLQPAFDKSPSSAASPIATPCLPERPNVRLRNVKDLPQLLLIRLRQHAQPLRRIAQRNFRILQNSLTPLDVAKKNPRRTIPSLPGQGRPPTRFRSILASYRLAVFRFQPTQPHRFHTPPPRSKACTSREKGGNSKRISSWGRIPVYSFLRLQLRKLARNFRRLVPNVPASRRRHPAFPARYGTSRRSLLFGALMSFHLVVARDHLRSALAEPRYVQNTSPRRRVRPASETLRIIHPAA